MEDNNRQGFTFDIVEHICVLGRGREQGYTKELNYVSFRGMPPKWDIREWNSDHTRMTKGITFSKDEMKNLLEGMKKINFEAEKEIEKSGMER